MLFQQSVIFFRFMRTIEVLTIMVFIITICIIYVMIFLFMSLFEFVFNSIVFNHIVQQANSNHSVGLYKYFLCQIVAWPFISHVFIIFGPIIVLPVLGLKIALTSVKFRFQASITMLTSLTILLLFTALWWIKWKYLDCYALFSLKRFLSYRAPGF